MFPKIKISPHVEHLSNLVMCRGLGLKLIEGKKRTLRCIGWNIKNVPGECAGEGRDSANHPSDDLSGWI